MEMNQGALKTVKNLDNTLFIGKYLGEHRGSDSAAYGPR